MKSNFILLDFFMQIKLYLIRHAKPPSITKYDQYYSAETNQITNKKIVLSVRGEQQLIDIELIRSETLNR